MDVSAWFSFAPPFCCATDSPEHNEACDAEFLRACEHASRSDPAAGYWSGKDVCMALMLLG